MSRHSEAGLGGEHADRREQSERDDSSLAHLACFDTV